MDDKITQQAQTLANFVWQIAEILRGDFKQSEYGRVILPFTVLRRLDCVLAPTKAEVLKEHAAKQAAGIAFEPFVKRRSATPQLPAVNTNVLNAALRLPG